MKSLTIQLSDDVYVRAERRASQRGSTLSGEVTELVKRYSEAEDVAVTAPGINGESAARSAEVSRLLAALDNKGCNTQSVGPLRRNELYERPPLH